MIEFGVAKKPSTPMEKLEKVIPFVSFVQLMGNPKYWLSR